MWTRGNERRAIFRDDVDVSMLLRLLDNAAARCRWRVLTYCLMRNHYHLLVETPEPNLSRGMRQLNGVYAQTFNRRHPFRRRFPSSCTTETYELTPRIESSLPDFLEVRFDSPQPSQQQPNRARGCSLTPELYRQPVPWRIGLGRSPARAMLTPDAQERDWSAAKGEFFGFRLRAARHGA